MFLKKNILGKKTILLIIAGLLLVALDQFLKKYFTTHSYYGKFFSFHLVKNTGASFGILQGHTILMIIISFIFIGLLIWYKDEFKNCTLCLLFLLAGTIGNLIDRLILGYVIDFVDLDFFPIFNLADTLITIGTIGLIVMFIKEMTHNNKKNNQDNVENKKNNKNKKTKQTKQK